MAEEIIQNPQSKIQNWVLTVGLEIHVELETETKMFCGCKNDPFGSQPNSNVCPVCYGLPGALPLLNQEAIKMTVKLGQTLKGTINSPSWWARKNYFYPDLPKGYQISQSTSPLVEQARLIIDGKEHRINRIHLEEDAGKLMHAPDGKHSLVDYNRAGVPLMEIVTEPDFHSSEAAKRFCQELQTLLRHLHISQADMEKGRMRCEANISVAKEGEPLGTKVEVKNINSFRAVERAINYEMERQIELIEGGEKITQETRTWNEAGQKTVVMRTKETSADYRYFPEPDLPSVAINSQLLALSEDLPEDQRQKLVELGITPEQARTLVEKHLFAKVEAVHEQEPDLAVEFAKWLIAVPDLGQLEASEQVNLLQLRAKNGWSKDVIAQIVLQSKDNGKSVAEIAKQFESAVDLSEVAAQVIEANPQAVKDYQAGKETAFNFLVGQVMAKTKGAANINQAREALQNKLSAL